MKSKIQIFIEEKVLTILSVLKIAILSKFFIRFPKDCKQFESCIILGNGPSLKHSLKELGEAIEGKDLICVNYFGETPYYTTLKPSIYVLIAPEMWMDDVDENYYLQGEKLFKTIADKTSWKLTLFIPIGAKKYTRWQNILRKNPGITVSYFNTTPIEGFESFVFYCLKKNLGMPRPHNVLIPSLVISLNLGYKITYLLGADHSWMKDMWVSDNNEVLLTQKHFYDEGSAKPLPMTKLGKGSRKMHEVLIKFVHAFKAYFTLEAYSRSRDLKIINATPDSYIDAFARLSLSSLKEEYSKP